jgi:hypothetical protein
MPGIRAASICVASLLATFGFSASAAAASSPPVGTPFIDPGYCVTGQGSSCLHSLYHVYGTPSGLDEYFTPGGLPLLAHVADGAQVQVYCQQLGPRVTASWDPPGSDVWDLIGVARTVPGGVLTGVFSGYVSDVYVDTPAVNQLSAQIPNCASAPPLNWNPPFSIPRATSLVDPWLCITQQNGCFHSIYSVYGTDGWLVLRGSPEIVSWDQVVAELPNGSRVQVYCQTTGSRVTAPWDPHGSTVWDSVEWTAPSAPGPDSDWVSDVFVTTPVANGFSPPIPRC